MLAHSDMCESILLAAMNSRLLRLACTRACAAAAARTSMQSELTCQSELDRDFGVEEGRAAVEETHDRVHREDSLQ